MKNWKIFRLKLTQYGYNNRLDTAEKKISDLEDQ